MVARSSSFGCEARNVVLIEGSGTSVKVTDLTDLIDKWLVTGTGFAFADAGLTLVAVSSDERRLLAFRRNPGGPLFVRGTASCDRLFGTSTAFASGACGSQDVVELPVP